MTAQLSASRFSHNTAAGASRSCLVRADKCGPQAFFSEMFGLTLRKNNATD